jgi:signal transduction histidine kinase
MSRTTASAERMRRRARGLRGLADRVADRVALFSIESEPGAGTRVHAEIPL